MANKQEGVGIVADESLEVWEVLFRKALILIDEIGKYGTKDPFWTFGGGTVLMLRYRHRKSKDIDIFVPDP
ncbi:MAG: nucleotidyl transferase AbiEii/AbiGii toxin family protein [Pseudomonadota bacterium]